VTINAQALKHRTERLGRGAAGKQTQPQRQEISGADAYARIPVIVRAVDVTAGTITVQRLYHTDDPPEPGGWAVAGSTFTAYPLPGTCIESYNWGIYPQYADDGETETTLGDYVLPRMACRVGKHWCIEHLLVMPDDVQVIDASENETEGGST